MCILADNSMSKYNTVLNHGTWFNLAATSDNRILYSSLDQTSVGDNRILNICSLKILSRAGVVGSGIDRPFRIEQSVCCLEVDQRDVCVVVAVEICDRSKVTSVGNTTDIKFSGTGVYDLGKSVHGRNLFGFLDQLNKKLFLHNVSVHEDITFLSTSAVLLDGFETFLLIQVQNITVNERFSCIINGMIQKSNICFRIDMCLQKFTVILCIYHIGRCNDNIWLMHTLYEFKVFCKSSDICIIYIILRTVLGKHELKFAALGVDVVMASGSQMLCQ